MSCSPQPTGREITVQEGFDPYYKWLGIPPREQPPHHYRLLAIPLFEADPEVIESAADQRMGHVRTFQTGPHSALSQQILNELAAARVCLLSREKKRAYDTELQALIAPAPPQPPGPRVRAATILPSPPPPIRQSPPIAPIHGPGKITLPPETTALSPSPSPFPPLDPTLPDPAPPSVTPLPKTASRPKFSMVVSTAGLTVLTIAAIVFWILYSNQKTRDSAPSPGIPAPQAEVLSEATRLPHETLKASVDESYKNPPWLATNPGTDREPRVNDGSDRETQTTADASPLEAHVEPPATGAEVAAPEMEETPTIQRSLAEVLEQATEYSQPVTKEQSADQSTSEMNVEKWRVPKSAVRNRVASRMQPVTGGFNTLLIEAQKPDRPDTEVYILLTAAHDQAIAAFDGAGALQAIDLIEDKFYGNFDDQRVDSLRAIGRLLSRQNNSRHFRELADVALNASQEAQQEGNKPLAKDLANVALEAARHARDTIRQERIATHLEQL